MIDLFKKPEPYLNVISTILQNMVTLSANIKDYKELLDLINIITENAIKLLNETKIPTITEISLMIDTLEICSFLNKEQKIELMKGLIDIKPETTNLDLI